LNRPVSTTARLARYGFADSARARDLLGPNGLGLRGERACPVGRAGRRSLENT